MSRAVRPNLTAVQADPSFKSWAQQMIHSRPACVRMARGLLRDEQLAEDVVEEAFVALAQTQDRFDPARSSQRSWLLMMTHRRAVDRIRADQRHLNEPSGAGPAVRAALLELPVLQRETLMLSHWGGYSQQEIAVLMECPLATVRTRCLSGMRQLRLAF